MVGEASLGALEGEDVLPGGLPLLDQCSSVRRRNRVPAHEPDESPEGRASGQEDGLGGLGRRILAGPARRRADRRLGSTVDEHGCSPFFFRAFYAHDQNSTLTVWESHRARSSIMDFRPAMILASPVIPGFN